MLALERTLKDHDDRVVAKIDAIFFSPSSAGKACCPHLKRSWSKAYMGSGLLAGGNVKNVKVS